MRRRWEKLHNELIKMYGLQGQGHDLILLYLNILGEITKNDFTNAKTILSKLFGNLPPNSNFLFMEKI